MIANTKVNSTLHLFYEQYQLPLFRSSAIMLRTARWQ